MKFAGGCVGKVLLVLLSVILGVVLTLGGIVGAGYLALNTSIGEITELVGEDTIPVEFTDETKEKTVLEWATGLGSAFSGLTSGGSFGELEEAVGIEFVSKIIELLPGSDDPDFVEDFGTALRSANIDSESENYIMNVLALKYIEGFGISLPEDIPLFQNETFMSQPISTAFSTITDYKVGDLINITEESAAPVRAIKDIAIGDLGEEIGDLKIGDMIDMGDDTSPVISSFAELKINELGGDAVQAKINGLKLSDVMTNIGEDSNSVIYAIKDTTIGELTGAEGSDIINSLFLKELMDIDESDPNTNRTLKALAYACLANDYVDTDAVTVTPIASTVYGRTDATTKYTYLDDGLGNAKTVLTDGETEVILIKDDDSYLFVPSCAIKAGSLDAEAKTVEIYALYEYNDGASSPEDSYYDTKLIKTGKYTDEKDVYRYKSKKSINDYMNELTLSDVTDPSGSTLLESISDKPITELGDAIGELFLNEIIEINDSSSKIMQAIEYSTMDDKFEADGVTYKEKEGKDGNMHALRGIASSVNTLFIDELMDITADTAQVIASLRYSVLDSQTEYIVKTNLKDSTVAAATVGATFTTTYYTQQIDGYDYYYQLDGANVKTVYVLYKDKDGNEKTQDSKTLFYKTKLYDGKNRPLIGLGEKADDLALSDVFKADQLNTGALSLVAADTKLTEVPTAVTNAMQSATVAVLASTGVISQTTFTDSGSGFKQMQEEQRAFVYNSNINGMLGGILTFMADPVILVPTPGPNYSAVKPTTRNVSTTSYASLTDFVNAYEQYEELVFASSVTVTVNPTVDTKWLNADGTTYSVPIFMIGSGSQTVTFSGATVSLAIFDGTTPATYTLSKHQAGYFYDKGTTSSGVTLNSGLTSSATPGFEVTP